MTFKTVLLQLAATDESGQDLIEYALVAALIGLAIVTTMTNFATTIADGLQTIGGQITSAV
jgi:pilus assembly protein Flp/PilA